MKINSKSLSRIAVVQLLYQLNSKINEQKFDKIKTDLLDLYNDPELNNEYEIDETIEIKLHASFFKSLSEFASNNQDFVNKILAQHLQLKVNELSELALNILHVAIIELKFYPEVASKIIINEYTTIANEMLKAGEVNLINSLLDKIAKERRSYG